MYCTHQRTCHPSSSASASASSSSSHVHPMHAMPCHATYSSPVCSAVLYLGSSGHSTQTSRSYRLRFTGDQKLFLHAATCHTGDTGHQAEQQQQRSRITHHTITPSRHHTITHQHQIATTSQPQSQPHQHQHRAHAYRDDDATVCLCGLHEILMTYTSHERAM